MTEASLKRAFAAYLRSKGWVVFNHADRRTGGMPDTSATGAGLTWWLELKAEHYRKFPGSLHPPRWVKGRAAQLANMVRLSVAGRAAFLVFVVVGTGWFAYTFDPRHVKWAVDTDSVFPIAPDNAAQSFAEIETNLRGDSA